MSTYVTRTCTEIGKQANEAKSLPLSHFRERHAYVLLGDPGSGKTTEFQREAREVGDTAAYVSARDFIVLPLESHPEWRGKTLFIDGLDEMRAGAPDARTPLDEIRARFDQLGQPSFRISCREADWLGANDLQSLATVSPNSPAGLLRLDPLSDWQVDQLLRARLSHEDAQQFMDKARSLGIGALLSNPQTLIMLAEAVSQKGAWPESRLETFEMACRMKAEEQNQEHLAGKGSVSAESVLDEVGNRCALHLLADEEIDRALHRHVAEFLGGRHLAKLITDGLPASRVVALMTSSIDDRVVTPLRGLSAWLAAQCSEARKELIDADPVGVGLYGDITEFSINDKEHLLDSLAKFATQGPLFGHELSDGRTNDYRDTTAWAFRSLASAEMADSIADFITDLGINDQDDRAMEFVLSVLSEAKPPALAALGRLEPELMETLRSSGWPPHVRKSALDAYLHIVPDCDERGGALLELLEDIHNQQISDPDDDLCGKLLSHLYPTWLPPSRVWRYLTPRNRPSYLGHFALFWRSRLLQQSSEQHVAELLDAAFAERGQTLAALAVSGFDDLRQQLLAQGREARGDDLEPPRLNDWLDAPGHSLPVEYEEERRQQQADRRAVLRSVEADLRENRASPHILHVLAQVFFAMDVEVDEHALPLERISEFVGGDDSLAEAATIALRETAFREDLPDVAQSISLFSTSRHHFLAYPALASICLLLLDDQSRLDELSDSQKRKILAIRYCIPDTLRHEVTKQCHDHWLYGKSPDLVLDVLYQCAVAALKAGKDYLPGLYDLNGIIGMEDQVHGIRIRLLRALSVRATSKQLPLLDGLLGQTLRYPDTAALFALVEKKIKAKSATDAQRVRWLTVAAQLAPHEHRQPLRDFVAGNDDRTRHLAEFLRNASEDSRFGPSIFAHCSDPALLRDLIQMLGRLYDPLRVEGLVTLEIDAFDRIANLISLLGSIPGRDAQQALADLLQDQQLAKWHSYLKRALEGQRTLLRDAEYVHPSIEQVKRTLNNGLPANAADLAALVEEHLHVFASSLRGDSSNPWRQFWNEDSYGRAESPKPENSCRDAVLNFLKNALPAGVDAVPEGQYAGGTRADIRVSYGGNNIPIEFKMDTSRDLWTGYRTQLIDQYTTDPATDEHGIYVPLWFGREDPKPTALPDGHRPTSAAELQERLEQGLEARKISVLVLDVSKPGTS